MAAISKVHRSSFILYFVYLHFVLSDFLVTNTFAVVFIGSTLFALQQLSGINAVFYFSSTVFKSFGVPSDIANICVGIAYLLGTDGFTITYISCTNGQTSSLPIFFGLF